MLDEDKNLRIWLSHLFVNLVKRPNNRTEQKKLILQPFLAEVDEVNNNHNVIQSNFPSRVKTQELGWLPSAHMEEVIVRLFSYHQSHNDLHLLKRSPEVEREETWAPKRGSPSLLFKEKHTITSVETNDRTYFCTISIYKLWKSFHGMFTAERNELKLFKHQTQACFTEGNSWPPAQ